MGERIRIWIKWDCEGQVNDYVKWRRGLGRIKRVDGVGLRDEGVSKSGRGRGVLRKEMYVMGFVYVRCVQVNCSLFFERRVQSGYWVLCVVMMVVKQGVLNGMNIEWFKFFVFFFIYQ